MNFLFIFYLLGVFIAMYQDFTRREIDDWLNLFLFFSGILFLGISEKMFFSSSLLVSFGFFIFVISLLSFAFYYGRFFSGGDSKLFFALSPIIFVSLLDISLLYTAFFIISLLFCGSIYGVFYSIFLFALDFKRANLVFVKELKKKNNYLLILLGFLFFVLGFINNVFFYVSLFVLFFIFLICIAKTLEEVSMKRFLSTKDLREGDWLFSDVRVGKKVFRKSWDGLSAEDVEYMKKFNKKVFVKDGIPYAPAFLFALILFEFRSYLLGIIFS